MKKKTIPVRDFDLPRLIETIVEFLGNPMFAFPFVDDGIADFGEDGFDDDMEETPLERLQHGRILFAQFTRGEGSSYELADGTKLEVPDDYDGEGEFFDECSAYGFLLQIADGMLTIETAVLRDVTLENVVSEIEDAGIFEGNMVRFIESMRRFKKVTALNESKNEPRVL